MNCDINIPIIFGASGFIGQHFIKEVGLDRCLPVSRTHQKHTSWIKADLLNVTSILSVLKPDMTVINLAYSNELSSADNIKMAENLSQACLLTKVKRLVHCSTAVVVGRNPSYIVNEETKCLPETMYEKTKCEIENIFLKAACRDFSVRILRPTGVIGPNGQNLKKLLSEIRYRNSFVNVIRSSLYGKRRLNLVPAKDVVNALLHLSQLPSDTSGIYICAADDDQDNNYHCVELLMRAVLNKPFKIRPIHLSQHILNMLLHLSRSGCGRVANRYYSSEKLFSTGFRRSMTVSEAVKQFVLSEI